MVSLLEEASVNVACQTTIMVDRSGCLKSIVNYNVWHSGCYLMPYCKDDYSDDVMANKHAPSLHVDVGVVKLLLS